MACSPAQAASPVTESTTHDQDQLREALRQRYAVCARKPCSPRSRDGATLPVYRPRGRKRITFGGSCSGSWNSGQSG